MRGRMWWYAAALLLAWLCVCAGCSRHSAGIGDLGGADVALDYAPGALTLESPAPAGVDAALWAKLTGALRESLVEHGKTASGVPQDEATRVADFIIVPDAQSVAQASWSFCLPGDYNCNGAAGVEDLVLIAIFYGDTSADENWSDAQVADGNNNNRIDLGDVTALGIHYDEQVSGFQLQWAAAADSMDWTPVQQFAFSTRTQLSDGSAHFSVAAADTQAGRFYRVMPFYTPPVGAAQYGLAGNTMRYFGGAVGANSWPLDGHDPQRSYRGSAPGPSAPRLAWRYKYGNDTSWLSLVGLTVNDDGSVYATGGSSFTAFQPDGTERWSHWGSPYSCDGPAIGDDGLLYTLTGDHTAGQLNAFTPSGALAWSAACEGDLGNNSTYRTLLVANQRIYVHALDGLSCYSMAGVKKWWLPIAQDNNGYLGSASLTTDGRIILTKGTDLIAVQPDGTLAWRQTLLGTSQPLAGVLSDGALAVPLVEGLCVYSADGVQEWSQTGFYHASNLACASDGSMRVLVKPSYLATECTLRGIARDGSTLFETSLPGTPSAGRIALDSNDRAYVSYKGHGLDVCCFDADGNLMWYQDIAGTDCDGDTNCVLGSDGGLYIASNDGLLCLRDDGMAAPVAPEVSASAADYVDHVRVSWTASPTATSYRVYRDGELLLPGETSELYYDDYGVPDGGWHNFTVSAVSFIEGAQSAPAQGRIKLPPAGAAGGDWAMLGHDARHTFRSNVVGCSAGTLKWSYPASDQAGFFGLLNNTPVFDQAGTAYITQHGQLVALSPDGAVRWRMRLGSGTGSVAIGADGTIYCAATQVRLEHDASVFDYARVYAINPNRTVKWVYQSPGDAAYPGSFASITLDSAERVHVVLGGSQLIALSPDGSLLHNYSINHPAQYNTAPTIGPEGNAYIFGIGAEAYSRLTAIDSGGVELWSITTSPYNMHQKPFTIGLPLPVANGDIITPGDYMSRITPAGEQSVIQYGSLFTNIAQRENGDILTRDGSTLGWLDSADTYHSFVDFSATGVVPTNMCLLIDGAGKVYAAVTPNIGQAYVYCFAADGSELWRADVAGVDDYSALALRDDGAVFLTNKDALYVFDEP